MNKKNEQQFKQVNKRKLYFYSISSVLLLALVAFICYYTFQHQWVSYRKAETAYERQDYELAFYYYKKALKEGVNLWLIGDNFAKTCLATNTCADALQLYEDLLKKYPDNLYLIMATANFYINLERYDKAVVLYKRAIELKPRDYKILEDLASSYKWNGNYLSSIKTFKNLFRLMKEPDLDIYIGMGNDYLLSENYHEAIKFYNKVLEKDPDSYIARKKLYLAYCWTGQENGGLKKLEELYVENPEDLDLALQIVKVYLQDRKYQKAQKLINDLHIEYPENEEIIYDMAYLEVTLGHMKKARDIWVKYLKEKKYRKDLLPLYATLMLKWHDYYEAEHIYKDYLEVNPYNLEVYYALANLYIKMQRYIDAESVLLTLLSQDVKNDKVFELMAMIYFEKGDYKTSNYWISKVLSDETTRSSARILKAQNYIMMKQYDEALQEIDQLPKAFLLKEDGQIEMGKLYLQMKKVDIAKKHFAEAIRLEEEDPILKFYVNFLITKDIKLLDDFNSHKLTSLEAQKIADIIASYYPERAMQLYRESLATDKNNYNAKIGLVLVLTFLKQYEESSKYLFEMLKEFPENSQILLLIARNYRSQKDFKLADKYYEILRQTDHNDYLLIQEIGQMHYEQKKIDEAQRYYCSLLSPVVDDSLLEKLRKSNLLSKISRYQDVNVDGDSQYQIYEDIYKKYQTGFYPFEDESNKTLYEILVSLYQAYEIQKLLYLENKSKWLRYREKNIQAVQTLKQLLKMYPDNESALFDYAQSQCSTGMCDDAKKTYKKILNVNPENKIVKQALKDNEIKSNSFVDLRHDYFQQAGRGDIDRIINNRTDLVGAYPISCRKWLMFTFHRWADKPTFQSNSLIENKDDKKGTYDSYGYSIEYSGVYSPYYRNNIGFSQKYYLKKFKMTNMGYIHLWYNMDDKAEFGLGYDRANELDNYFSLDKKIQTNSFWFQINSLVIKRLEINAKAQYYDYNDHNGLILASLNLGCRMQLHPTLLKFSLYQEFRNINKLTSYIYNGIYIRDIIHPYWTPRQYYAFLFTLSWNHDISKYIFCGNQKHFYDLRFSVGGDTEKNPTAKLEGTYHYEFLDHWTINIYGLYHRSSLWNSEAIQAQIKYQF